MWKKNYFLSRFSLILKTVNCKSSLNELAKRLSEGFLSKHKVIELTIFLNCSGSCRTSLQKLWDQKSSVFWHSLQMSTASNKESCLKKMTTPWNVINCHPHRFWNFINFLTYLATLNLCFIRLRVNIECIDLGRHLNNFSQKR